MVISAVTLNLSHILGYHMTSPKFKLRNYRYLLSFYFHVVLKPLKTFITGLPVADSVVIFVFGRLRRKTNTQGRKHTRSGTEKRCSHKLFHTIFSFANIFFLFLLFKSIFWDNFLYSFWSIQSPNC